MARCPIVPRVAGIKPVNIGEQQQQIGADHRRDTRGKAVIVAKPDFRRCNGIVFIHDRHRAEREKRRHGGARIEMPSAGFGVLGRQQNLRDPYVVCRKRLAPGMCKRHLPGGGGGLLFLDGKRAPVDAKAAASESDGAAGNDDDILALFPKIGDVAGHPGKPFGIHGIAGFVDQQRRADLDDDGLRGGYGVACRHGDHGTSSTGAASASRAASITDISRRRSSRTPAPLTEDRVATSPAPAARSASRTSSAYPSGAASVFVSASTSCLSASPDP